MVVNLNINGADQSIHISCDDESNKELHHTFFTHMADLCSKGGVLRIEKIAHDDESQSYLITTKMPRPQTKEVSNET